MKLHELPYASYRVPLVSRRGVVATSQPLAAQIGLMILAEGGSAVDAAIATAAALTVLEPTSNGLGSDAFALVWDGGQLYGLNGSGRSPQALTRERVVDAGYEEKMPNYGWMTVTVPGAVRAWRDLHERFGRLDFERVLSGAIAAAEEGFAVTPVVADSWRRAYDWYTAIKLPECAYWADTFSDRGKTPNVGDRWRSLRQARTLRRIAQSAGEDFYSGELAEQMVQFSQSTGGFLALDDLKHHTSTWVQPISTSYRGYDVWEIPPNGQGLAALIALNILEGFDLARLPRESAEAYHLQLEAMKLAVADAERYIADPEFSDVPVDYLLSKEYAALRRSLISETALMPEPGRLPSGGTVLLCAADSDGMMISFIQSNFWGFGSGVVVPDTGIALQNRGAGFSLDLDHPNMLLPGKRPFHTIIPAFLTHDGEPVGPFGVMGGAMQPQGHVQMVLNTIDWQLNPQASLDAPRWQVAEGRSVWLEQAVPQHLVSELRRRGHAVDVQALNSVFGRGQIIWRLENGSLVAGSDPRADGQAVGL